MTIFLFLFFHLMMVDLKFRYVVGRSIVTPWDKREPAQHILVFPVPVGVAILI
jgi:hypothetical protein